MAATSAPSLALPSWAAIMSAMVAGLALLVVLAAYIAAVSKDIGVMATKIDYLVAGQAELKEQVDTIAPRRVRASGPVGLNAMIPQIANQPSADEVTR